MDMELVLYRAFSEVGLPTPNMRVEVPVGDDPNVVGWLHDLFAALIPRIPPEDLVAADIGDLETLASRLEVERIAANAAAASVGLVGAWSRKPG